MCGFSGCVEWRGFGSGVRSGLCLTEGVMDPLDGGAAVLLPLVSVVSSNVLFGPVNLPLRGFLELLSFPSQNGLRRVLRRRGACEEMSCWSCQPWLISLVAARAEIAGFDSVWRLVGAPSPIKLDLLNAGVLGHESSSLSMKVAD
ncbi:hypothetical protein IGI04_026677 [Brassica rapa subsp. trilocularis]|uniref:Uncharacterized protein n=1 Tax=Brassica rapa subsp. trilocularis TaxID=1813537 RepID=A0ABQ7KZF3_BRACM|nr:hypothetical protein IGI04_026677 [Brassica rapa subsp. trilocularis]